MSLKRHYTMSEVQTLLYESEGRKPKPSESDSGHTVSLHGDMRGSAADGRQTTAIILAATIEESRRMDPAEGFVVVGSDEKEVDARFTTRLDLIKAVTAALNSSDGQIALGKIEGNGKPAATFVAVLSPPVMNVERFTRLTGKLERGLKATSMFVKICRIGNGKTARLHIQTAYPKDVS